MIRPLLAAVVAGVAFSGCTRNSRRLEVGVSTDSDSVSQRALAERSGFVGWIKDVRGSVILVDEEVATNGRHGEIYVETTTEIVSRMGMIVPQSWLKRGLRVTVHFKGQVNPASSTISGTAQRIVVDM